MTGQEITTIRTIGSWYDNNCLQVIDDKKNFYKISCDEIIKLFNANVQLEAKQKRKHTYLIIKEVEEVQNVQ